MFTQAASGETIKLLKSVEISTDISLEKENTYVTLDLDRFNLTAQSSAKIILTKYALTVVAQNYNRAALLAPVQIGENGLLYIRSTLDASKIGEVTNHNDIKLYRLSVIGIPTVTQGKYGYDINQTGYFFNRVTGSEASEACLWLPSGEVTNLQYSDNVTTDPQTKITDKITIIAKHDNRFIPRDKRCCRSRRWQYLQFIRRGYPSFRWQHRYNPFVAKHLRFNRNHSKR